MYFIQRDSDNMWLLSYKHGLNSSERPTCVWGSNLRDALPFKYIAQARALAASITGCTVVHKRVKGVLRSESGSANPRS